MNEAGYTLYPLSKKKLQHKIGNNSWWNLSLALTNIPLSMSVKWSFNLHNQSKKWNILINLVP